MSKLGVIFYGCKFDGRMINDSGIKPTDWYDIARTYPIVNEAGYNDLEITVMRTDGKWGDYETYLALTETVYISDPGDFSALPRDHFMEPLNAHQRLVQFCELLRTYPSHADWYFGSAVDFN